MDRFIWIGDRIVNLDCVVYFIVEDTGKRVTVLLRGVSEKEARISLGGHPKPAIDGHLKTGQRRKHSRH